MFEKLNGNSIQTSLKQTVQTIGAEQFTKSDYKTGTIKHIVLFRFKPDVTKSQIKLMAQEFDNLQQLCLRDGKTYIQSIIYGKQISGEGAGHDFTLGFIVTFQSEGDRNFYVGEPLIDDPRFYDIAHHNFKKRIAPLLESQGALVFDFLV
ncbi:Dabb family protein [Brucellaceae bacterium C25G]